MFAEDYSWEESVHQTAFTYLKYRHYEDAFKFLEKSDLKLELYNSAFNENNSEWILYIHTPIEIMDLYTEFIKECIIEAYDIALGTHDDILNVFLEMKKVQNSEFQFNFNDRIATLGKKYDYDVAFSFAGEDREYVEKVADCLRYTNVRIFYDRFKTVENWGKDLYTHFDDIYRKKSKYCVMFLSKSYAGKLWTDHERKNAQARAFQDKEEYILPVRFDNTEIPGIRPTIGYIDANDFEPEELAEMINEKIKKK